MIAGTKGFTLFELVLTLLLAGLLAGLAIPSLAGTLARQRQSAEINALFHAVHLARKESVMRKKVVSLCPTRDGKTCSASLDWSAGWLMFENRDRDSPPQIDNDEPLLLAHQTPAPVEIRANRKGFTFRATFLRATNGTFVLCDPERRISPKALVVSYTGRPRVARHSPDGELYSCAD